MHSLCTGYYICVPFGKHVIFQTVDGFCFDSFNLLLIDLYSGGVVYYGKVSICCCLCPYIIHY